MSNIGKLIFYVCSSDDSQVFIQFSLIAQLNLIYYHDEENDRTATCCVLYDGDRPPSNTDDCMQGKLKR
jgi:hypothetical protein